MHTHGGFEEPEGFPGAGVSQEPGCDEGEEAERKDQAPGSGQCARPSSLGPHRERLGACRVSPGQCGLGALGTEARLSLQNQQKAYKVSGDSVVGSSCALHSPSAFELKIYIYIHIYNVYTYPSHFAIHLKITQLCESSIAQFKKK